MIRVVGVGRPEAGDDGVGPLVAAALPPLPGVEVLAPVAPWLLVELCADVDGVVVVDAALGGVPGAVHAVPASALLDDPGWSTHDLSVGQALGVARAVHGAVPVRIVAVDVGRRPVEGAPTSDAVRRAVPCAVALVRAAVEALQHP